MPMIAAAKQIIDSLLQKLSRKMLCVISAQKQENSFQSRHDHTLQKFSQGHKDLIKSSSCSMNIPMIPTIYPVVPTIYPCAINCPWFQQHPWFLQYIHGSNNIHGSNKISMVPTIYPWFKIIYPWLQLYIHCSNNIHSYNNIHNSNNIHGYPWFQENPWF